MVLNETPLMHDESSKEIFGNPFTTPQNQKYDKFI